MADTQHQPLPLDGMDLDISDFLRQLSPSPNPNEPHSHALINHGDTVESSPEPPDVNDIQFIRERLISMGVVDPPTTGRPLESISSAAGLAPRERELAEMVLRLTHPALHPCPSQVLDQAATISQLTRLRDFLLQREQDERQSWEAERANWVRVAGALTARRFEDGQHRADSLECDNVNLISENVMLKRKLQDQQARMETLEAELRTLRPLLLLRPVSPPPPPRPSSSQNLTPSSFHNAQTPRPAGRPRKRDKPSTNNTLGTTPSASNNISAADRFSDDELDLHHHDSNAKPGKPRPAVHNPLPLHHSHLTPTKWTAIGDARTEHLLLASRKLGKQKIAAMLPSSAFPTGPAGGAPTLANLGLASSPNLFGHYPGRPYPIPHQTPGRPVYHPSQLPPGATPHSIGATPAKLHALPVSPLPPTPSSHGTAMSTTPGSPLSHRTPGPSRSSRHQNQPQPRPGSPTPRSNAPAQTPRTPRRNGPPQATPTSALEHLINASKMIENPDQSPTRRGGPPTSSKATVAAAAAASNGEGPPQAKRRRTESSAGNTGTAGTSSGANTSANANAGPIRVLSALDVLAEQATIISPQKEKGKEKEAGDGVAPGPKQKGSRRVTAAIEDEGHEEAESDADEEDEGESEGGEGEPGDSISTAAGSQLKSPITIHESPTPPPPLAMPLAATTLPPSRPRRRPPQQASA